MQKYGFGVDIGGTSCKMGLFTADGDMLEKWEIPTSKENNGSEILEHVAAAIEEKMAQQGIAKEELLGIGLDVPGPVGSDGMVSQCVNLGWVNYPAAELLQKRMGVTVKICNDANAAALGEMWRGGGEGYSNLVMVTLGTGVGGAVILDGKMIPGVHGIAGEIGHITVHPGETDQCACGKHGCLEQYASATGIVRIAGKMLEDSKTPSVLKGKAHLTAKAVFDAAKDGDEVAKKVIEVLGEHMGRAFASAACIIDPEVFVIGGGVSRAGEMLIDVTRKYYEQEVLPAGRVTKIALATLGNDAGMYGCVKMLL